MERHPFSSSGFLKLPTEIIEAIAKNLLDQRFDWDAAQVFFTGYAVCPSAVRRLSQVCYFVHNAVERVLYRDVNLRTDDKFRGWSESSLSSFIRTLNRRPELARLVQRATLKVDPDEIGSYVFDKSRSDLLQLFTKCTNIHTLFVRQLDGFLGILPVPIINITTLAFSQVLDKKTLKTFPMLRNLFFYRTWGHFDFEHSSCASLLPHLQNLRIFARTSDPSCTLERAVALCGKSVRKLRVDCPARRDSPLPLPLPRRAPVYHPAIESLYVSDVPFLFVEDHCMHMPSLSKLSIAGNIDFTPDFYNLSRLPPTLRTLVFIQDITHEPFTINLFKFVSKILRFALREVTHIDITQSYRKTPMHLNLGYADSWLELCNGHCVQFDHRMEHGNRSTISIHMKPSKNMIPRAVGAL